MTAISLISLMSQNPLLDHISETEQVSHIVTINVRSENIIRLSFDTMTFDLG